MFYSSNNVFNTLIADSAIPYDTNSATQCANENSDDDYLNGISLEYQNIEIKEPPLNEKLTKIFKIGFGTTQNLKKLKIFQEVLYPQKILKV